jgi:hypothetical protein
MAKELNIEINDIPFNPELRSKKIIRGTSSNNGKDVYLVYMSLSGRDLINVRKVEYLNHPDIIENNICIHHDLNNQNYTIKLWTPYSFALRAIIHDKDGDVHDLVHYLTFEKYFDPAIAKSHKVRIVDFNHNIGN